LPGLHYRAFFCWLAHFVLTKAVAAHSFLRLDFKRFSHNPDEVMDSFIFFEGQL
jgi:hypothetical protein